MSHSTSGLNVSDNSSSTFILVDGHSLAFRSYFAFAKSRDGGLRTTTGIPTSASFGFLKSLLEVMTAHNPQSLVIAFDLGLPTFRHEADDTYKADREETPEDFIIDLKHLQELLAAFNLKIVTAPGYEADDVLGTLATRASAAGYTVKILTGDQDLFQLVDTSKNISVLRLGRNSFGYSGTGKAEEYGPEQVKEKLGILPAQVVDYKALCGDKSDNIPGVRGIGEKTAVQLLSTYNSLDDIYASIDQIKGAVKTKLETSKNEAYHSQMMAQIITDVPVEIDLEDCRLKGFDESRLIPMLEKLEFKSFLPRVKQLQRRFGGADEHDSKEAQQKFEFAASNEDNDLWFFTAADTEKARKQAKSLIEPRIIQTEAQLKELVQLLQTHTDPAMPVAWDTETTDLEPRDAELVGIGCCWGAGAEDVAYLPISHAAGGNLDKTTALEALRPILESAKYPKVLQNAKFDRLVLRCQGIELAGVVFETMLASYLINPENNHSLSELSSKYLGIVAKSYDQLVPKNKTIADIDIAAVADYCGMDVYTTFLLVPKLREELDKAAKLHKLLLEVEQPLEPVLAQMEYTGIHIDTAYLKQLSQQMQKDLETVERQAYEAAGEEFNIGSPKQVAQILFEKLQLDVGKSRKTKTGYSTDAATLERLQGTHPVVDAILEYRTLDKLKSTYVDSLPKLVRADTHRVHTDFNQAVTTTGRLSSSNPNLQNIPIRTEFSRQIRKAFVPESGWLMVSADYSQIELRILAHLSQEPVLVEAYRNNQDVHTVTAQLLFDREKITSDERRIAKTINFGVIYGMGSTRFARSIGKTSAEGREFINRFKQRYSKVFDFLQKVQRQAISQNYVETILGRRRYVKFENSSLRAKFGTPWDEIDLDAIQANSRNDADALRSAANAPIQGSSADIIKLAMVKMHDVLRDYQSRMLLQVHDELVLEVLPDEWEELQPKIKSAMENALPLSVPLLVDIHAGQNWMETK
ncbi:MAG: DNA polymerase I [Microcoleus vaginatus WJT46-NPBG5]|jgi:DNA polymerase-1|nr:DNA polymerase I [Microcoleus vaginatus WJT46-NPBG5]